MKIKEKAHIQLISELRSTITRVIKKVNTILIPPTMNELFNYSDNRVILLRFRVSLEYIMPAFEQCLTSTVHCLTLLCVQ